MSTWVYNNTFKNTVILNKTDDNKNLPLVPYFGDFFYSPFLVCLCFQDPLTNPSYLVSPSSLGSRRLSNFGVQFWTPKFEV